MEFTININVTADVTPRLEGLLSGLLAPKAAAVAPQPEPLPSADNAQRLLPTRETATAEIRLPHTEPKPEPLAEQPTEAPSIPEPKQTEEAPTPVEPLALEGVTPPQEPQEPQPVYDVEFVRAAIDRTRCRIEGDNYKNDTTSERYKKYHKLLTAEFKNLAMQLGGCLPTSLPTAELRMKFAQEVDLFHLDEEGNLVTQVLPF